MKETSVAVGVVVNENYEVLISFRSQQQHQGGLWEFPGGKIEPGETNLQALARELNEELGIAVSSTSDLTRISHDYGDKRVDLRFMLVRSFLGIPKGNEGQQIKWVKISDLLNYQFPAANQPVVALLQQQFHCS